MKHLTICKYGSFLGVEAGRLSVSQGNTKHYYPLNRLSTVSIAKRGISISSDLIEALSQRGVKLFFLDFRGVAYSAIIGESQHGVVAVREAQQDFCRSKESLNLAIQMVIGKIKNQKAVLNYFGKYHSHPALEKAVAEMSENVEKAKKSQNIETLLGFEGAR